MQNRENDSVYLPPVAHASVLASPWARLAAVAIDVLTIPAFFFLWSLPVLLLSSVAWDFLGILNILSIPIIVIVQMVLLGTRGQTIGKIALSIRIVDAQTGVHPGWARLILLRSVLNIILCVVPGPGQIYFFVDSLFIFRGDHRTIHDMYSTTRVDKI